MEYLTYHILCFPNNQIYFIFLHLQYENLSTYLLYIFLFGLNTAAELLILTLCIMYSIIFLGFCLYYINYTSYVASFLSCEVSSNRVQEFGSLRQLHTITNVEKISTKCVFYHLFVLASHSYYILCSILLFLIVIFCYFNS